MRLGKGDKGGAQLSCTSQGKKKNRPTGAGGGGEKEEPQLSNFPMDTGKTRKKAVLFILTGEKKKAPL